jgi:hypothetical protein
MIGLACGALAYLALAMSGAAQGEPVMTSPVTLPAAGAFWFGLVAWLRQRK